MNFQEPTTILKDGTTDLLVNSNNDMPDLEIYRETAEWFNSKSPLNSTNNGWGGSSTTKKSISCHKWAYSVAC